MILQLFFLRTHAKQEFGHNRKYHKHICTLADVTKLFNEQHK